tara:strand:- start:1236 stop:4778 length:3543 start_codon:yes stop_codon:yes gene_type:complete
MSKTIKNIISEKKYASMFEKEDDTENTILFKRFIKLYIDSKDKLSENIIPELEIRFGTKKIKYLTKIDFNNVIKSLLFNKFKLKNETYSLKVILESEDSNIRTEIFGLPNIQYYCKNNNINGIEDLQNIKFVEKKHFAQEGKVFYPLDYDEFNMRISYQLEENFNIYDDKIQKIIKKWDSTKKIFRFIKRFEFKHPELPLNIHCSVVKMSQINNGKLIPQFNISDSNVFNSFENYEIEIECINSDIGIKTKFDTGYYLHQILKNTIKIILVGLQESNYPINLIQQNNILNNYLKIIKNEKYVKNELYSKINVKDFIGPSSITLQNINLLNSKDIDETNKTIPNIRNNYCVTDKADGLRKLLFISNNGKMYFILMNMNIQFTGLFTENKELFNTIIDGEHITNDKYDKFINLFACFDIYFINNKNVTSLPLINTDIETKKEKTSKKTSEKINSRLDILNSVISKMNSKCVVSNSKNCLKIVLKKFYSNNIFKANESILNNIKDGLYEYNTDGLIFTPTNTGVGSNTIGINAPDFKITWKECFKWKPPEYNTIDFLVKFKKDQYNKVVIHNNYNDGLDLTNSNFNQYITLILQVGFDEKMHGYINPFNMIIEDTKINNSEDYKNNYKPMQFYPTNPSDENAGLCNIHGIYDKSGSFKIYTLENEEIEDNSIVEFKYDNTKNGLFRWIPLKVRYDKTSELKSGVKNFGNAYHVANGTWHSIHYPISEEVIKTGNNILIDNNDDDVYYNKINSKTETRSLRDFHNLYIKNELFKNTSASGNILIDYACGKGGDLPKWIKIQLNFILGIDLSKDNIENRLDGACARYLNYKKKYTSLPDALFLNGNSGANIKSGDAFSNTKNKNIMNAILGIGTKNESTLGKGVYKNYGIAHNGFNISSIMFALHYMFEKEEILNEFLKNIAQNTAINGYFIGCCFDGKKIFKMLESIENNESISLFKNNKKIWQITKKYDYKSFDDDESSLGYAIDIYQESINKTIREYLVNFDYLVRVLENYGFVALNDSEIRNINMPSSITNFELMYNQMVGDLEKDKQLKNLIGNSLNMSSEEKQISFLNNCFVFKKVRNISNIPSLIKNSEEDEKTKMETMDIDKKILDEQVDSISKDEMGFKMKQESVKLEKEKEKKELTIDEKIKLAEERKKAKLLEKELEKQRIKEEKLKKKEKTKK